MYNVLETRAPAVAGTFYPSHPQQLRWAVNDYLRQGREMHPPSVKPSAIVAPHAGYVYSGPVAGTAYAQLDLIAETVRRVILVGPAHYVGFHGLAVSRASSFSTPLGQVPTDTSMIENLLNFSQVHALDQAHAPEHSLEVHLPFLQVVLSTEFTLVPILIGTAVDEQVTEVLESVWCDDETLLVVSSDLSHYHPYELAKRIDGETSKMIEGLRADQLTGDRACGYQGIRGMLRIAKRRGLSVKAIDLRNSGDTAGPHEQVVGYGAYIIFPESSST